eukprot:m.128672 g.128672  ORF g.128672 m.128672 type:complete len:83 (+) comp15676_c0_seq7:111-359(+)
MMSGTLSCGKKKQHNIGASSASMDCRPQGALSVLVIDPQVLEFGRLIFHLGICSYVQEKMRPNLAHKSSNNSVSTSTLATLA